jgi:hypothetical protein
MMSDWVGKYYEGLGGTKLEGGGHVLFQGALWPLFGEVEVTDNVRHESQHSRRD